MKKNFRCICSIFFVTILGFAFAGAALAAPKYQWRIASETIAGSVADLYAQELARLLKEKSNGDIQLEIYHSGSLGTPTEMFELTLAGAIEFCLTGPSQSSSIVPENQILGLQFLFSDNHLANRDFLAESKALNEMLNRKYEAKGITALSYFAEGAMFWTANKPINKPEDFNGVKIRVMPSELLVETYKAYGANPTPLSFTELYSALQLNIVEAQENAPVTTQEMKFMDVQKYLIGSRHNVYVMQHLANVNFMESLPEDIRQIVLESVDEVRPYIHDVQVKLNQERLQMMVDNFKPGQDYYDLTSEERNVFKEEAKKADETYYKLSRDPEFAKNLLATFRSEMEEIEKRHIKQ
ncbi:DctP family TRAP transporter solute-binding subunit [Desulfopila inferna]|uniref:DctP family TRAP transporter solute-binding subunit n=1 Tax=Desulfopila inferna TaxID=468528 RepID=UPI0019627B91|nr:DctP family TRAP transporter solute-binding subunit [Desulfopila inferna]MBM9603116.1 DctP family TRAP transporter solute-binding subunit [Desulfopila inferna]